MLTPGHIAASYILAKSTDLIGYKLSSQEILLVIAAGYALDIDFIVGSLFSKKGDEHHKFPTHTPLFSILLWIVFIAVAGSRVRYIIKLLTLASLLLHLVLDDIGYWFYKLGLQQISSYPQINWLYPFTKFEFSTRNANNKRVLSEYLKKAKANVLLEILLVIIALILWRLKV